MTNFRFPELKLIAKTVFHPQQQVARCIDGYIFWPMQTVNLPYIYKKYGWQPNLANAMDNACIVTAKYTGR